jgi:predicted RNA-binding protein YlxR (DUF448 family)/ribosomal protein L7Ae-like RNA K-turn-binding protein
LETVVMSHPSSEKRAAPTRTCVGCGLRDDAADMVRLVVEGDEVVFDLAGGSFGRGAHVHARPACLGKAPRGLSRAFKREVRIAPAELGRLLVVACDRRLAGLLLAARRTRVVAIGADEALGALRSGKVELAIVAADAGSIASKIEVQRAVAEGRAVAWKTKTELGALLGEAEVAICGVCHAGIAAELRDLRAAADAGAVAMREGGGCSSTVPEAR